MLTTIYVDGVAQALEGEEADAHGKEDVLGLEIASNHLRPYLAEEVGVFEISQKREVDDNAQRKQQARDKVIPPVGMSLAPSADTGGEDIVGERDQGKQTEIQSAALVIEII